MYEYADDYLDISQLKSIQNVVADCYTSYVFLDGTGPHLDRKEWKATRTGEHIDTIKNEVMNSVTKEKNLTTDHRVKWIWSCDYEIMNGCLFGLERPGGQGGIYNVPHNKLNLSNNDYIKLPSADYLRDKVEDKLGFSLNEDYILCQTGFRQGYELSKVRIDHDTVINKLKEECRVVLMDFKTFRLHDSYSEFETDYDTIQIEDIKEQSVLISNAKRCVFFTEGHLRSHNYLPPMFGKDVDIVASKEIFTLSEAPLDFWNENVFKFGGKMIAKPYEDIIND